MTGSTKKRKAESTGLDEMDRELYQRFRAAANSVSSLYTSSLNLQKRAFNGGARHTTEKLLQWALSQQASGEKTINASDLIQALQAELVVLEGEDACLAAAGDSPGGMGVWTPADARRGGGGGRAQLANIDFNNMVRPSQISRVPPPQPPLPPRPSVPRLSRGADIPLRPVSLPNPKPKPGLRAGPRREARTGVHCGGAVVASWPRGPRRGHTGRRGEGTGITTRRRRGTGWTTTDRGRR